MAKKKSATKTASKKKTNEKIKLELKKMQNKAKLELKKAQEKFKKQEKKIKEFAKKNPEKAMAIAAGLGAAIGAAAVAVTKKRKK